jgi:hypothetical protein
MQLSCTIQLPFFELVFFGYFFGQCKKVTAACIRQKPRSSANGFIKMHKKPRTGNPK